MLAAPAAAGERGAYEPLPEGLVRSAQRLAPVFGTAAYRLTVGRGLFRGNPAAIGALTRGLRPLDLLFVTNEGKWAHRLLPGHFSHVAVWLGTRADVEALGLGAHPALAPVMRAGPGRQWVLEAVPPRVRIAPVGDALPSTLATAVRVQAGRAVRRKALSAMAAQIGRPFDFRYDIATPQQIFCTELLLAGLPRLGVFQRRIYATPTILPDDLAQAALAGHGGLSLLWSVRALPGGRHEKVSAQDIRAAIRDEGRKR